VPPLRPAEALARHAFFSRSVWDVLMTWLPHIAPSPRAALHAVDLLVRFLASSCSVELVTKHTLQAYAAACMCLVCKALSESVSVEEASRMCAYKYNRGDMNAAEMTVLRAVDCVVLRGPCMLDALQPLGVAVTTRAHEDAAVAAACSLDFLGAPDALDVVREVAEAAPEAWGERARVLGALKLK
jgi:hypothetical protein